MNEEELNALKGQIDQVLIGAQARLEEINTITGRASAIETNLNELQQRVSDINAFSEGNSDKIQAVFNEAQQVKAKIDELYNQSSTQYTQINETVNSVSSKVNAIEQYFPSFEVIKGKIEDSETGLSATFNKSNEYLESIKNHRENARIAQDEVLSNKLKSDAAITETNALKADIAKYKEDSLKLKEDIGKILNLVSDTGLANSFDTRRKRSEKSIYVWGGLIILSVITGIVLINKIFLDKEAADIFSGIESDYVKFLLRLTLTSPAVFFIWFSASQFSKERHILEQYEFKTAAALALENYTRLLKDNYPSKEDKIFELAVSLIQKVYKQPIYSKDRAISDINGKVKVPQADIEGEFGLATKK